jgi:hypothetical protein
MGVRQSFVRFAAVKKKHVEKTSPSASRACTHATTHTSKSSHTCVREVMHVTEEKKGEMMMPM